MFMSITCQKMQVKIFFYSHCGIDVLNLIVQVHGIYYDVLFEVPPSASVVRTFAYMWHCLTD